MKNIPKLYDVRRGDTGEFLLRAPALIIEQILWLHPTATRRIEKESPCVLYCNDRPFKLCRDATSIITEAVDGN
jgi:hypothetical protein